LHFDLVATAEVGEFDYETTSSDEVSKEVAKRLFEKFRSP